MSNRYSPEDSYSEPSTRWTVLKSDAVVKRAGETLAVLFAVVVCSLVGWILATQVDYGLLETIFPRFVEALRLVAQIIVVSSCCSVLLGVFVGLGRISSSSITKTIATAYVEFFRGTPFLFQLFVIFYGIPRLWATGQFPITNWAMPAAIIGLTLNHGAYVGEAVRGGITAVEDGQLEAARSLGMSRVQAMRAVVLPQAWRNALPAIGNDQIILVKDTSLLTVIAVPEIMSVFRNVNSNQLDPWTPLVWVCLCYLLLTTSLSQLVSRLERRADWSSNEDTARTQLGRLSQRVGRRLGGRE